MRSSLPEEPNPAAESLPVASLLSAVGGFLDSYSYLCRGHVFANAVTGNMVFMGLRFASGEWRDCGKYLLAVLSFGAGVFAADLIRKKTGPSFHWHWQQIVMLTEIILLLIVPLIPYGRWDFTVNCLIAFVSAMQAQSFQRVQGVPFASTMCTGNLRSGTDAFFQGIFECDPVGCRHGGYYYGMIGCFIGGAAAGTLLFSCCGKNWVLLAPAIFSVVFVALRRKAAAFSSGRR